MGRFLVGLLVNIFLVGFLVGLLVNMFVGRRVGLAARVLRRQVGSIRAEDISAKAGKEGSLI